MYNPFYPHVINRYHRREQSLEYPNTRKTSRLDVSNGTRNVHLLTFTVIVISSRYIRLRVLHSLSEYGICVCILSALNCDLQVYAKFIVMLFISVRILNSKIVKELSN